MKRMATVIQQLFRVANVKYWHVEGKRERERERGGERERDRERERERERPLCPLY